MTMKKVVCSVVLLLMQLNLIYAQTKAGAEIDLLLNQWHKAASNAQLEAFFAPMHPDFVYIGTDATERWTKAEFYSFSKPYFDQGKAWDFTLIERKIYFSADGKTAWFNETLNTWMGVCRSSGVLQKVKKEWKLMHYHLSVAVPNAKIQVFLDCCKTEFVPIK